MTTTLDELQRDALRFRDEREWARFHTPKNLAMAIAGEAGELCELFQWKDDGEVASLLAEDPAYREKHGVRIANGQGLWGPFEADKIYTISIESDGGLNMTSEPLKGIYREALKRKGTL